MTEVQALSPRPTVDPQQGTKKANGTGQPVRTKTHSARDTRVKTAAATAAPPSPKPDKSTKLTSADAAQVYVFGHTVRPGVKTVIHHSNSLIKLGENNYFFSGTIYSIDAERGARLRTAEDNQNFRKQGTKEQVEQEQQKFKDAVDNLDDKYINNRTVQIEEVKN